MGLNHKVCHLDPNADWPVRLFYGLVTIYQGLFGIFVSSSVFYQLWKWPIQAFIVISILLITGALLIADGVMALIRYCTDVDCRRILPTMAVFQRRRPWFFIPPVFCYFVTLSLVERTNSVTAWTVSYYLMLAVLGVVFSLRDGLVGLEVPGDQ